MSREPESAGESPAERQLRQQLDAAEQRMRAIMHGISHDLRAPVRAIDGFVARLGRQLEPIADPATAESVQRIRGAVQRMSGLIDGLLELARAGNAPLNPTQVDVSMLADWCLAELQDLEPARDVQADVEQGLSVLGDERLLKMMLAQLLRNAWQFSATRPRAEITVSGRRDGDALELVIRDNGIGFDTAYAGKLLEPFQRLHGIEQGAGAGIGLATAQQVALRHGGGITGDAVVDAGAVFHVRLRDLVAGAA